MSYPLICRTIVAVFLAGCLAGMYGQSVVNSVPRLVRFSNSFRPANGQPATPVEGITLSIYGQEREGTALWQEVQNVTLDAEGRYTVLLGSTQNDGLPADLFSSGESRWLGVQFQRPGEAEQPRVLLVSVPYALKASDAETLGGRPASAYLLSPPAATAETAGAETTVAAGTVASGKPPGAVKAAQPKPLITSGTAGSIAKFINTTDLGNSIMTDNGSGVGVGTSSPADRLHAQFTDGSGVTTGYAVQNLSSAATAYSGMLFYDQNGALGQFQGFNNSTHEYRINNIATSPTGSINFMLGSSSKFLVARSGNIGISTSSPGSTLDVNGDINFNGNVLFQGSPVLRVSSNLSNTSLGLSALAFNTTGFVNTAIGRGALSSNTTGFDNTAIGVDALDFNTTGVENTATGVNALFSNTTGNTNTATGIAALSNNTTGSNNIAMGFDAGFSVDGGNSDNIHIGNTGDSDDSATIRIGSSSQTKFFVAGVRGVTTVNNDAVAVLIDSAGQLGTRSSSRRFKEDIQDMGEASRGLLRLRPVTFRYRQPFGDGSKPIQYGLIAEEVAEVYPDLVAHSADGQIESVKYQVLDTLLLNEVQRQESEIRLLRERLAKLETALAATSAER